ncbi:hypothetical protein D049_0911B, partial [Vibrio parahaemolyticus VPTS-2010]
HPTQSLVYRWFVNA